MTATQPVIIVVEDDADVRTFLEETLRQQHFTVYSSEKGSEALKMVEKIRPSMVILDLGLPDVNGETVCAQIKTHYPEIAVMILTASEDSHDLVESFAKGADDYLKKPFSFEELLARLKARLKHFQADNPVLTEADLTLNTETLEVTRAGRPVQLTQTEFRLLHYLLSNTNRVLSREQILSFVWSQDPDVESRVVDVYIGYLRKKIDAGHETKLIHSKRGFGYVLKS